ncbi:hypothetical protein SAMN05428978_10745 [Nitrosomonas sp. Nm34]|nr:hypothetical protein SAMN05428978_10745 [Nitrosomonas sp. Nm34]
MVAILLLVQHDFVYLAKKIKLDGQVQWLLSSHKT